MVGVGEVGVAVEDAGGFVSGVDEYVAVGEAGHFEAGEAALSGTEEVAGAAELEVYFGELESIVILFDGLEALPSVVGGVFGQEQAEALVGAASDATAELVKLGEAEPVGGLYHHDGGVGYVYADLDDGGGDEDVQLVVVEGGHDVVFLAGGHPSVEEADAEVGEDVLTEAFVFLGGGLCFGYLGLLYQWEDDECLAAFLNLTSQKIVGRDPVVRVYAAGDDGGAAGGHLVDGRDVEIAVEGEGEGAGNRSGGHDEHVGRGPALAAKGCPLHDPEAVLLVDDGESEIRNLHGLLDEGVGAYNDVEVAVGGLLLKVGAEGLAGAAGDEADGDGLALGVQGGRNEILLLDRVVEAAHKLADGVEVLLGEDFGGHHDGALEAHCGDGEESGDGDDGLTAADFALEEAVHRGGTLGHVCEGFLEAALLGPSEGEGQSI